MVDLGGYVIILVETKDKKIKLYGSPADKADLEVGDEILEVNGRSLENATHTEVISHIHQCIRSRTICLRVKRKPGNKLALDLAQSSNVQDAFVIAVEQQARERLEKLSALRKIKPVDMTKLSQQLSDTEKAQESNELNGIIESNSVYVTSVPGLSNGESQRRRTPERSPAASVKNESLDLSSELELNQEIEGRGRAVAGNATTVIEVNQEWSKTRERSQERPGERAAHERSSLERQRSKERRRERTAQDRPALERERSQERSRDKGDQERPPLEREKSKEWSREQLEPGSLERKRSKEYRERERATPERQALERKVSKERSRDRSGRERATLDRELSRERQPVDLERAKERASLERERSRERQSLERKLSKELSREHSGRDQPSLERERQRASLGRERPKERSSLDQERHKERSSFDLERSKERASLDLERSKERASLDRGRAKEHQHEGLELTKGREPAQEHLREPTALEQRSLERKRSKEVWRENQEWSKPIKRSEERLSVERGGERSKDHSRENSRERARRVSAEPTQLTTQSESQSRAIVDESESEMSARRLNGDSAGGGGASLVTSDPARLARENGGQQRADSGKFRNKVYISHNDSKRSSKESLSSHKSSRTGSSTGAGGSGGIGGASRPSRDSSRSNSVEHLEFEAVISELDRGPHREMAVDVPESFIARTKTPPRYPPPKDRGGSGKRKANGGVARPEPPPRGSLGSPGSPPAPAPRPSLDRSRGSSTTSRDSEPSREHMERIRKYQEDIRRDREMREKRTKEEEFLRSSLRGSEKMKRLEQRPAPAGFVNNGFETHDTEHNGTVTGPGAVNATPSRTGLDETHLNVTNLSLEHTILDKIYPPGTPGDHSAPQSDSPSPRHVNRINSGLARAARPAPLTSDPAQVATPDGDAPPPAPPTELTDLLTSLKQIQRALRSNGHSLQQELLAAQTLLTSPDFQRALAVHNKVQEIWCYNAPPTALCQNAQEIVQDVITILQGCPRAEAAELADLLTRLDMEGILQAHDHIASRGVVLSGSPEPSPLTEDFAERVHHYTDPRIRVVRLEKTNEPLGATVKNEGDSVLIGRIVKGGAADKSGLLRPGDEVLEVNGIEMRGKSVDDVCDILAGMTGSLVFLILPREEEEREKTKPAQTVMHVKAHFDYDPEDDMYLPCREIGMSFQKGDILHITSQEDPDWWQATRDGDEDMPLSGLIPSLNFQTQREALKQSIIDSSRKETAKKSKFLCAKRSNKKKKRMYNAEYNDDYEANEILTYEEVGLYYPRANHKRPVVLIGPHNLGRHELRQKLMEDTERFSAAVPHTSRTRRESEIDGQDYHFISRQQFEQDIVNRLFVEHGEYERAYYGTSINAIRTVVNSGRICVLNLHPHSLKILKNTDLKPFVVFVAPPSLEKLRQMKLKTGEQFRDEELKQIIEKAREIEEVYGHYFDIVIVNSDLSRAYEQLVHEVNTLDREPQWVPAVWLRQDGS